MGPGFFVADARSAVGGAGLALDDGLGELQRARCEAGVGQGGLLEDVCDVQHGARTCAKESLRASESERKSMSSR